MSYFEKVTEIIYRAKELGYEETENGARLFGFVKDRRLGFSRWWHFLFPPLSNSEIELLEHKCRLAFPSEFREFLKFSNGLILYSGAISIDGHRPNYDRSGRSEYPYAIEVPNTVERILDAKPEYLFVGGYSGSGARLYINTETGIVYRCEEKSSEPTQSWPNFQAMLVSESLRLSKEIEERQ